MKNGFTLVELSIVLVIIGLLVGGILVGQSLVDSAKLNSEIRQYQQLSIAYQMFVDKFKKYPGDSNFFSDPGDNDGRMENDKALNSSGGFGLTEERANFWKHIGDAKLLPNTYTNPDITTSTEIQPDVTHPSSHIDDNVVYSTWIDSVTKILYFATYRNVNAHSGPREFLPTQALAIDVKLDDGIPDYSNGSKVAPAFADVDCVSGGEYNVSSSQKSCKIVVRFAIVDSVSDIVN